MNLDNFEKLKKMEYSKFLKNTVMYDIKPIYIIVVDCELTGPRMDQHSLVNLAAVCYDLTNNKEIDNIDLMLNVPEQKKWDQYTIEDFWQKKQHLIDFKELIEQGKGIDPKDAIDRFVEFLKKYCNNENYDSIIAADHVEVDLTWINYYLTLYGYPPVHALFDRFEPIICLYSYYLGLSQHSLEDWIRAKKRIERFSAYEAATRLFSITKKQKPFPKTHLALNDSRLEISNYQLISKFLHHLHTRVPNYRFWFDRVCGYAMHSMTLPPFENPDFPPLSSNNNHNNHKN